jgi:hypothetical protein
MSFNRISSRVAIGLFVILLASPTFGQGLQGMQLFAPSDVSTYGGAIEPNEGFFFQYDILYWSISPPKTQVVGFPGLTRTVSYGPHPKSPLDPYSDERVETSTLNTGDLAANFSVGNRFDFGRIEDRNGWLVSIYQLRNQGDNLLYPQADVVFNDPPQGSRGTHLLQGPVPYNPNLFPDDNTVVVRNLPVTLYNVTMLTQVNTWGVEANYLHRALTCHGGGTFEFLGGARYLEFNDMFGIQVGKGPDTLVVPDFLSNSTWFTNANNHVVGPQVGLRWFKKQGRWMLSTEGRFVAGLNCQNVHQTVFLGPNLNSGGVEGNSETGGNVQGKGSTTGSGIYKPTAMSPTSATADAYARVFTPLVELRLEGRYQITRAISFHAGWTGFWMDNIVRANGIINYTVPAMGIDMSNNKQNLFVNGLTLGFDVNR